MKLKKLAILVIVTLAVNTVAVAQTSDTTPPKISEVQVSGVTDNSVTVTWNTDENADSLVNYGIQPDYGILRTPIAERKAHTMTLSNLEPGRVYYFRVVSADSSGNQGISADYRVQTTGSQQSGSGQGNGQSQSQSQSQSQTQTQTTTEEIKQQINQIQSQSELKEILNETVKAIQGISEDLTIVGPPTVIPETTAAVVKWTTDRESTSEVFFSPASVFDGTTYQYNQVSTAGNVTEHEVQLIGLSPFTEYSFKVKSTDTYGIVGESRNYTFTTKASAPDIRNLRVLKVEENAATLAWDTTVPAKALVEYQDQTTGGQNSVGRPTLATTHQIRLADLTLGTRYVAFVTAENAGGDRVKSQPIQFVTVKDTAAPIISNVTNDSTIFPGGDSRIQTIVQWTTDETANCVMTYQEGVAGGTEAVSITREVPEYKTNHTEVVVDFAPGTVYQFFLECTDEAGNKAKSENFVLFTPIQEKNIIDLILENFQSTFGWVKNIKG
jgi:hypothetical protein